MLASVSRGKKEGTYREKKRGAASASGDNPGLPPLACPNYTTKQARHIRDHQWYQSFSKHSTDSPKHQTQFSHCKTQTSTKLWAVCRVLGEALIPLMVSDV